MKTLLLWFMIVMALVGLISGPDLSMISGYEVKWFFQSILDDLTDLEHANIPFLIFKLFAVWFFAMVGWQLILQPAIQFVQRWYSDLRRAADLRRRERQYRREQREFERQRVRLEAEQARRQEEENHAKQLELERQQQEAERDHKRKMEAIKAIREQNRID